MQAVLPVTFDTLTFSLIFRDLSIQLDMAYCQLIEKINHAKKLEVQKNIDSLRIYRNNNPIDLLVN